jgi:hypothetical protein
MGAFNDEISLMFEFFYFFNMFIKRKRKRMKDSN